MRIIIQPATVINAAIVFGLIFIAWGDVLLPKPLSTASHQTRTHLNQVLLKMSLQEKPPSNLQPQQPKPKPGQRYNPDDYFNRALKEAERQTKATQ